VETTGFASEATGSWRSGEGLLAWTEKNRSLHRVVIYGRAGKVGRREASLGNEG
jgi:hypothetical protein